MFTRKVTVQAQDTFSPKSDLSEVVAFIREQRVPGELRIAFGPAGGIRSIVFDNSKQVHRGEIIQDEYPAPPA